MIHTFKFLGTIPAGRILKSEPVFEGAKVYWLIVVDDDPERPAPREIYSAQ